MNDSTTNGDVTRGRYDRRHRSAPPPPNRPSGPGDVVRPLSVLRRWWPALLVAAVLGAAIGSVAVSELERHYESSILVLVGPVVADAEILEGTSDLARTYGEIAESRILIDTAVENMSVDADRIEVAARSERGSATLEIRVRSPYERETPLIAAELVDALRQLVEGSGGDVSPTRSDSVGAPIVAIGSEIVVLDDGGGRAEPITVSTSIGSVLGAMIALLCASAAAVTIELRLESRQLLIASTVGASFGTVGLAPRLLTGSTGASPTTVSVDSRSRVGSWPVATGILDGLPDRSGRVVLLVTSRSASWGHRQAVLQLMSDWPAPVLVIDPYHLLTQSSTVVPTATRTTIRLDDDQPIGVVISPPGPCRRDRVGIGEPGEVPRCDQISSKADVLDFIARYTPDHGLAMVFAPATDEFGTWRWWASAADSVVLLIRSDEVRDSTLRSTVSSLSGVGGDLLGGVLVTRRWISGSWAAVDMSVTAVGPRRSEPRVPATAPGGRRSPPARWQRPSADDP